MPANTFLLVTLSALTHAYWNFLLKRSAGSQTVVALSKIVEAALFLPILLFGIAPQAEHILELWLWPAVGAGLVLLNYLLLAAAYSRGDLSVIYPVVRGGMLLFLPPLAYVTLGERLTLPGWIAIAAILCGIVLLQVRGDSLRNLIDPASILGLAAGLAAAGYTIWDKRAIQLMAPVTYFAAYTVILGAAYAVLLVPDFRSHSAGPVWRGEWRTIVQIGGLNSGSYLLALVALKYGAATHVIAVRQLSIAIGALLGWYWLAETMTGKRMVGLLLVVCGCLLMGVSR